VPTLTPGQSNPSSIIYKRQQLTWKWRFHWKSRSSGKQYALYLQLQIKGGLIWWPFPDKWSQIIFSGVRAINRVQHVLTIYMSSWRELSRKRKQWPGASCVSRCPLIYILIYLSIDFGFDRGFTFICHCCLTPCHAEILIEGPKIPPFLSWANTVAAVSKFRLCSRDNYACNRNRKLPFLEYAV